MNTLYGTARSRASRSLVALEELGLTSAGALYHPPLVAARRRAALTADPAHPRS